MVLLAAALLAPAPCLAQEVLLGCDYLPTVNCIEDFSPYWVLDKWSVARSRDDLRIMRAIGCSCVRLQGFPDSPDERHLDYLNAILPFARDVGLSVHLDIGTTIASAEAYLGRCSGRIESYQFGGGTDGPWDDPVNWPDLQELLDRAGALDPQPRLSVPLRADALRRLRQDAPALFDGLGVVLAAAYDEEADIRGWVAEHVPFLANIVADRSSDDYGPLGADGSYGLGHDKQVWVTEITAGGSRRWGSLVNDGTRAQAWPRLVHFLANAPGRRVTRVYHYCFRDNMAGASPGRGQCGIVRYDGTPTLTTAAFREAALHHARPGSLLQKVSGEIDYLLLEPDQESANLILRLENHSRDIIRGRWAVESPPGMTVTPDARGVRLEPQASYLVGLRADVKQLGPRSHHVFARFECQGEVIYAWGVAFRPEPLTLDSAAPLHEGVAYIPGIDAVARFLARHGEDTGIIAADTDRARECGYRLKIALETMTGVTIPLAVDVPDGGARELLDMPLILVGPTQYAPRAAPASAADAQGWWQAMGPTGLGAVRCPAVLVADARDDQALCAAVYDLIGRLWLKHESEATGLRLTGG